MIDTLDPKPGFSYWIIGTVALLWNLLGVMAYVMQVSATPEQLAAAYTPEQVELLLAIPAWATSMTAIATTFGVLGSILLLLRRKLSTVVYAISLVALIIQNIYSFGMTETLAVFGTTPLVIQSAVMLIAVFLVWYSRQAGAKGWLR